MLRYEPIRGSHAVQEAVFYLQFAPEIPTSAFAQITSQSAEIEAILPVKADVKQVQFEAHEDGSTSFKDEIGGIEFQRLSATGAPSWTARFTSDGISVHCTEYSRYDEVWAQSREILLKALKLVPTGHAVGAVGMRYIDRFRYNPEFGDYDLTVLFRTENRYVAPRSFQAQHRWHCHNGWFAPVKGMPEDWGFGTECLNQLNISSAVEISPANSATFVTIDHNLSVRPKTLGDFQVSEKEHVWLDDLMLVLHKDNKLTMSQLLTDSVCKRLNLVADEKGQN